MRQHVLRPPRQGAAHGDGERGIGPISARLQDKGGTVLFPYPLMIRKMLEQGEIRSAKNLLTLALSRDASSADLSKLSAILAPAVVRTSKVPEVDRAHEYAWLSTHGNGYRGEWVAVAGDNLLGHSRSLASLLAALPTISASAPPLIHWIDPD